MRSFAWLALVPAALACGSGAKSGGGCSSDAECSDANACSTDTCDRAAGTCGHAYDPAMAVAVLAGSLAPGATADLAIPTSSGGTFPVLYTACPGGPDGGATPRRCIVELDVAHAALGWQSSGGAAYHVAGTIPVRLAYLPIDASVNGVPTSASLSVTGNGACPPSPQTFVAVPVDASVDLGSPPVAQLGYALDAGATAAALAAATTFCSGAELGSLVAPFLEGLIADALRAEFAANIEAQLCATSAQGPCPQGTSDGGDGVCRFSPGGPCATRARSSTGLVVPPACMGA
jgi:hypothetical protein